MELDEIEKTWVRSGDEQFEAVLLELRARHRILRLADGRIAKTVINSGGLKETDTDAGNQVVRSTERIRLVQETLPRFGHDGILRTLGPCTDAFGDVGFLCEPLEMHEYDGRVHPKVPTIRAFLIACSHLASAAGILHLQNLVHGDITPHNVGFRGSEPVLLDFEMLTIAGETKPWHTPKDGRRWLCCTPACASPEQVHGYEIFPYSDVYCLGLTMLSWVSGYVGVHRSHGQPKEDSLSMCANGVYPFWERVAHRLACPEVTEFLFVAIQRCPYDRYRDGTEFARTAIQLLQTLPTKVLDQLIEDRQTNLALPWYVSSSASTIEINR